jgi:hypothetical protein
VRTQIDWDVCSIRTCGEYIYKGKKFNARKETVMGEDYYGIKVRLGT